MSDFTKREIARVSSTEVHAQVFRHSVSFIRVDKMRLASGTLVSIGDRLFVATAAHTFPVQADEGIIWLLPATPRQKDEEIPRIIRAEKVASERPDVGLLELDRESALTYLDKTPCDVARLHPLGIGREQKLVSLVGSPGDAIKHVEVHGRKGLNVQVVSYSTVPFAESEWPSISSPDTPGDTAVDVFLDYPSGDKHTIDLRTGNPLALPDAPGTSGGGIWDQGFTEGELWSVENCMCYAIQSRWHETRRYLRAVQIIHWLRLVYDHYPDLRTLLDEQCPDQSLGAT